MNEWYRAWRHEELRADPRRKQRMDWLLLIASILALIGLVVGSLV